MAAVNVSRPTVVAVGHKAPEAAKYVVNEQFARFQTYCDGQLAAIRYRPFDPSAPADWQRGWLDARHTSNIPLGDDPEDYEDRRRTLYAEYGVALV